MTEELAFHWRAEFTDGSVIKQFDETGERSFKEVQDKEDVLTYFYLELQNSPERFVVGVSLTDGSFNINEFVLCPLKEDVPWHAYKPEYRVINFRRVRKSFTMNDGILDGGEIDYFIGWQTTFDGKNYKKLFKVGADGTFSVS